MPEADARRLRRADRVLFAGRRAGQLPLGDPPDGSQGRTQTGRADHHRRVGDHQWSPADTALHRRQRAHSARKRRSHSRNGRHSCEASLSRRTI